MTESKCTVAIKYVCFSKYLRLFFIKKNSRQMFLAILTQNYGIWKLTIELQFREVPVGFWNGVQLEGNWQEKDDNNRLFLAQPSTIAVSCNVDSTSHNMSITISILKFTELLVYCFPLSTSVNEQCV